MTDRDRRRARWHYKVIGAGRIHTQALYLPPAVPDHLHELHHVATPVSL